MKKRKILMGCVCVFSIASWYLYYAKTQSEIDTQPPVLSTNSSEFSVSIKASDEELIEGVIAMDALDGDVSESIMIENIKKKGSGNTFEITYVAFDKSNNMGKLTRTLHYSDYRQTHFGLSTALRLPENQKINLLSYFTADDCIDGSLTPFITIEGDDDVLEEDPQKGFYECVLSVTNSVGYTTKLPIEIEIYEASYEERMYRPVIFLNKYITYLSVGDVLNTDSYLKNIKDITEKEINFNRDSDIEIGGVNADQRIPVTSIKVTSNVDTNKPGIYSVIYSYTSKETGYKCNTTLMVVVE